MHSIGLRRLREGDETPRVEADVAREVAGEIRRGAPEVLGGELVLEKLGAGDVRQLRHVEFLGVPGLGEINKESGADTNIGYQPYISNLLHENDNLI